ncbi:L,D-transpeptidase family protein [Xanthobacter tagetidis]|uniref:L,D-transpeptidase catalytic domain protein n=1 Tax=Xanthobacter tagetidis TaxID=60216 RepID=A0A3L7AN82_9HYPH|nr:L,D-transpeptidase family protein [Xanthobacter tagetidis]MBB6308190.1 L,D-peptidoglycan transpeptidase YkuD (ErfK/YbiS/YcfS/YnhG family) [Xanthobacter tagetidis]RLP81807.1 L,D-transpeptidase catalytic domain protein [Xanthobacter tagetidis]
MKGEHPVGISRLLVRRRPGARHFGLLIAGGRAIPVALGRAGPAVRKREGDGRTPVGRYRILRALYRPDRMARPKTRLPLAAIRPGDGWSDDPADRRYNRPVALPVATSHERMWRDDALYDLVLVIDHNTRPRVAGHGSAVFIHAARPGFSATEGCVALTRGDLRRLVERLAPGAVIEIAP